MGKVGERKEEKAHRGRGRERGRKKRGEETRKKREEGGSEENTWKDKKLGLFYHCPDQGIEFISYHHFTKEV